MLWHRVIRLLCSKLQKYNLLQWCKKVKNFGVIGGINVPSPVGMGLTDLPKFLRGGMSPYPMALLWSGQFLLDASFAPCQIGDWKSPENIWFHVLPDFFIRTIMVWLKILFLRKLEQDPIENRCNATFEIFLSNCVLYLRNVYLLPGLHQQKLFMSLRFVQ